MNRKRGPKKNRAIKFFTARPIGILRGGVGSVNRRRPLKPFEEYVGVCQKSTNMLLRIFQMPKSSDK